MEYLKFGTMYEGGTPIKPSSNVTGDLMLTLGDTVPGMEIRWLEYENLLVADRCVCTNISWNTLRETGILYGKPVKIDGKNYLCRSLKVGCVTGDSNEWDDILNVLGEDNKDLHWLGVKFWGQETVRDDYTYGILRGGGYARNRSVEPTYSRTAGGFRPVLEPLGALASISEKLIGSTVKLWGPRKAAIEGRLVGLDDYDVTLDTLEILPTSKKWGRLSGGEIIISRAEIKVLKQCD